MQESKIYEIWLALTRIEQREFGRWLAYDNVRDDVRRLYEWLCAVREKTVDEPKAAVFAYLYGETAVYNDMRLRHAQSLFMKNMENFLSYKNIKNNLLADERNIANQYLARKQEKAFETSYRRLQTRLVDAPQHAQTLHEIVEAEQVWLEYQTPKRPENNNVQALLFAEEKAFAARKLRTVCTAISYQNVYKKQYDLGFLEPLLANIVQRNWQEDTPAIGVYFYTYQMLTQTEGLPFFSVLVERLPAYQGVFMAQEYQSIYTNVLNFAIQEINRYGIAKHGDTFLQQLFMLYKTGIEKGFLLNAQQQLSVFTYKNIVAIGLRLREMTYIRGFLDSYRSFLPAAERKLYYEYNLARYYFANQDFERAMPLLNQLGGTQIFLLLDAKIMLLKMYYELDEYDLLEAHLHSFGQFLHRKRSALSYHQTNYKNIIALTKQLMLADLNDKNVAENLRKLIAQTNPLTEREWLLQQVFEC